MFNPLTLLIPLADPEPAPFVLEGGTGEAATTGAATGAGAATQAVVNASHTGWTIGMILFAVVVLVVVALVLPIIALAGRIGHQAPAINDALLQSKANTAHITALEETIDHARVITAGLYRARARLGG